MEKSLFEAADQIIDGIAEQVDQVLASDQLADLRQALVRLSKTLGAQLSVSLDITVDIFDPARSDALPLLRTGLSTSGGEPPYRTWSDSSPQRYVVEGEVQVVPHDRCPRCYGPWEFKFKHRSCPGCEATLGQNVKLLLDTDTCPYCEEGKVSMSRPVCDKCGHNVDPGQVVWG